jgi:pyridoxamine 5'-phosphate oxidase-like protein
MGPDDPVVREMLERSMVARIATRSRGGRPSVTPLYFVPVDGWIWLGTVVWTRAVRNVTADPRVSLLFGVERDRHDHRVLRVRGTARVLTERDVQRSYDRRIARKYVLTPEAIRHWLAHVRQVPLFRDYRAQGTERGGPCVIEVTPEAVDLLVEDGRGR